MNQGSSLKTLGLDIAAIYSILKYIFNRQSFLCSAQLGGGGGGGFFFPFFKFFLFFFFFFVGGGGGGGGGVRSLHPFVSR